MFWSSAKPTVDPAATVAVLVPLPLLPPELHLEKPHTSAVRKGICCRRENVPHVIALDVGDGGVAIVILSYILVRVGNRAVEDELCKDVYISLAREKRHKTPCDEQ